MAWTQNVAEPDESSDLLIPPLSCSQVGRLKAKPIFSVPLQQKTGQTNCCFGKVCVICDQTLVGDHLTDVLISKLSKHVKDHEVKIKSQMSWRKLSHLKKEDRKKRNENKPA